MLFVYPTYINRAKSFHSDFRLILLNDGWLIIYIKNNFFIYKSVLRKVKVKQIFFLEKQKIKSNHFNDSVINRRKKQKIDVSRKC